jgi:hypothetical protein
LVRCFGNYFIVVVQSAADIARISKMLANNFMFENLTVTQKEKAYKVITSRNVAVDEVIIREGDKGDEMYIIDRCARDALVVTVCSPSPYLL